MRNVNKFKLNPGAILTFKSGEFYVVKSSLIFYFVGYEKSVIFV